MDDRERWVDVLKGVLITLVALHHALSTLDAAGQFHPAWSAVDEALTAVRMPLFFVLSGLYAGRSVRRPAARFWRDTVGRLLWLLMLWLTLEVCFYTAAAVAIGHPVGLKLREQLLAAVTLNTTLWYVAALALSFTVLRLSRSIPSWVQITAASAVGLAAAPFHNDRHLALGLLVYPVWFLAGAHLAAPVRAVAARLGAERVARHRVSRPVRWLGQHTLPVYLLHPIILSFVWPFHRVLGALAMAGPLAPTLLTVAAVVASLGTWRATYRAEWLYGLPAWIGAAERQEARAGQDRAAEGRSWLTDPPADQRSIRSTI